MRKWVWSSLVQVMAYCKYFLSIDTCFYTAVGELISLVFPVKYDLASVGISNSFSSISIIIRMPSGPQISITLTTAQVVIWFAHWYISVFMCRTPFLAIFHLYNCHVACCDQRFCSIHNRWNYIKYMCFIRRDVCECRFHYYVARGTDNYALRTKIASLFNHSSPESHIPHWYCIRRWC